MIPNQLFKIRLNNMTTSIYSKENPYGFIYITTNLINGRKYLGQHKIINHKTLDSYYLGSGSILKQAIKKYGKINFKREIVGFYLSSNGLNEVEIFLINQYNCVESNEWYNLCDGGLSGAGYRHTEETKAKISEASKGRKHTDEAKRKNSEVNKGRKHTDEHRKNRSESMKGKKLSEEHKKKMSDAHKGKKRSSEDRAKMSEAAKGKPKSEEHKLNMSKTWKLISPTNDEIIFKSPLKQKCKELGLSFNLLRRNINNKVISRFSNHPTNGWMLIKLG